MEGFYDAQFGGCFSHGWWSGRVGGTRTTRRPFPASIASADATPPLAAPVAPGAPTGLRNEQRTREQHQQQFLRAHSDATGKVRLDLMSKGVERTKQMQVAPYIGAHALAPASAPAAAAKHDQSK